MIVGSPNSNVVAVAGTSEGKISKEYSKLSHFSSYAMTMKFIKNASFYNANMYVRAYVKLNNGTYRYTTVKEFKVYDIADKIYQRELMPNMAGHDYLYDNILKVVNPSYVKKDFDISKMLAKVGL